MNQTEISLHYIQSEILKRLSLQPKLRFNDLVIENLESEHMNYHLKKLISYGLVKKDNEVYELTDTGKDYTNSLDDSAQKVEKQPKTSIIIGAVRKNENGEIEHLLCKRLKHPYFGKVGRLTGKVRFGETLEQAAQRELYEETGLTAEFLKIEKIYHKLRHRENGEFVQDGIFYIFFMKDLTGKFIEKLPYQENFWISKSALERRQDLDLFDQLVLEDRFEPKELEMVESVAIAEGF